MSGGAVESQSQLVVRWRAERPRVTLEPVSEALMLEAIRSPIKSFVQGSTQYHVELGGHTVGSVNGGRDCHGLIMALLAGWRGWAQNWEFFLAEIRNEADDQQDARPIRRNGSDAKPLSGALLGLSEGRERVAPTVGMHRVAVVRLMVTTWSPHTIMRYRNTGIGL
ncbi:hypothetical protein TcBrA4_0076500, partial [Trypanosoma cruzi]